VPLTASTKSRTGSQFSVPPVGASPLTPVTSTVAAPTSTS
ncbi:hypothetical protein A2U01_0050057, partial [Trifolium medium]|nr:hypothetical protein [Trifolium medium]